MGSLRVALCQVDATVGDIAANTALVSSWLARALDAGADLVAFPEMVVTGYPIEDLAFRPSFAEASRRAVEKLAADVGDVPVVVGYLDHERGPRNAAAVLHRGSVAARYFKHHLPNYGVFDERRYFTPGAALPVLTVGGAAVAVTICEDLWQDGGPVAAAGSAGAELVVVVNGSPYERGKADVRAALVARRAAEAGAPFAYANLVGGQDELVFDGDSMVVAPDGTVLARAPRFAEHLLVVDVPVAPRRASVETDGDGISVQRIVLTREPATAARTPLAAGSVAPPLGEVEEVWRAVVLGTRDYVRKNGFSSVVLGLSGGIDSAVVATVAVDAIGADAVHTVAMPSAYSSPHSVSDAADLAARQGTRHRLVSIEAAVDAFHASLGGLTGLAAENLQARVRGMLLMALSNAEGHLVLTTGNKSELATGFSTLYGDSAGGFAPIKDVPKTLVWELARWRNAVSPDAPPIPEACITKPPSAELAPGQLDEDRLPPYAVLDALLESYVEDNLGRDELVARGFDPAVVDHVIRLVDVAEFKRRQYPPGPKITERGFGRDWRLPITSRWRDQR